MELKKKYTEYISEKERIRAMEENCARLRDRIAKAIRKKWANIISEGKRVEEEEKRKKQQELKANQEEIRKAWAQKMAAAKLEKKLQKEKKEAEFIEKTRNYCTQLGKDLKTIKASLVCIEDSKYNVYASEDVDVCKLFTILKGIVYIRWNCFILDLKGDELIEITDFDEDYCSLCFYQEEERDEMEFNKGNAIKQAERFLYCYLENRKIKRFEEEIRNIIQNGVVQTNSPVINGGNTEDIVGLILQKSNYVIDFKKDIECYKDSDMLIVNYELPTISNIPNVKTYKYIASSKEIETKQYSNSYIVKRYEDVLYSITLRSLYEIFSIDTEDAIKGVTFNGFVTQINPATGINERKCILSVQVDKNKFSQINLLHVEPKTCFKALKGVSGAKLVDVSPVTPILMFNKNDKRFIEGKNVPLNQGTNLAAMHWEDFEHLVRELFEMEFGRNGGEVRVTQASRDGGVDAIIFDPDPLRGGKIVVQAKRYTNTVGVSAVRDLYGTVINEGANTGILITTSDYGHDSYEFAKDKPLKLLNGGHLLALLHKNGRNAHIDIEEAKRINEGNKNP